MATKRQRGELGSIAAEHIAVMVVVAAVIAAVVIVAIPDRTQEAGEAAVDCLFAEDPDCHVPFTSTSEDDADGPDGSEDDGGADDGPRPDLPPREDRPPPDRDVQDDQSDDQRGEGDPATGNEEVDELYELFDAFDAYLWDAYERDGYDGQGGTLRGHVNYEDSRDNAHFRPGGWPGWLFGYDRTTYGTGMATPDIVAHELAHALVEDEVSLDRAGEDHALNEALADMFASNMTDSWEIGEDSAIGIIRDMEDPERLGHPGHVDDYLPPTDRTNHQHVNAGIPNHAYYLMTEEVGRQDAEQILYRAVTDHLDPDGGFEGFRTAMLDAAEGLYSADSDQRRAVREAFAEVGLDGSWEAPS